MDKRKKPKVEYEKPPIALGEKYTKLEIQDKLVDYVPVVSMSELEVGTQIKYFKKQEDDSLKFCEGGFIANNSGLPEYVMIAHGTMSWGARLDDSKFFRKITWQDIKIQELEDQIKKMRDSGKYKIKHK
jgi:hypothetical protein